jgi:cytochrome c oxidase subunit III
MAAGPRAPLADLAHHFDSYEQQREAATLGMWLFLVTEILFFGGLFAAYTIYRWQFPESFRAGSHELDITLGTINTAVLIASSLTMALAVRGAQTGRGRLTAVLLLATILLGSVFLVIKGFEYHHKWTHHHVPGPLFQFEGEGAGRAQMFFVIYFAMTGLHALHMIIGVSLISALIPKAWRGGYTPENHNFIEGAGLYWHFVDLVWIFLFPLLYLVGRH